MQRDQQAAWQGKIVGASAARSCLRAAQQQALHDVLQRKARTRAQQVLHMCASARRLQRVRARKTHAHSPRPRLTCVPLRTQGSSSGFFLMGSLSPVAGSEQYSRRIEAVQGGGGDSSGGARHRRGRKHGSNGSGASNRKRARDDEAASTRTCKRSHDITAAAAAAHL